MIRQFASKRPPLKASSRLTEQRSRFQGYTRSSQNLYQPKKISKLQDLVKTYTMNPNVSLSNSVKNLAKRDEEFNRFLKNFKTDQEPEWSSITECRTPQEIMHFAKDLKKSEEERLAELHIQEKIRKLQLGNKFKFEFQGTLEHGAEEKEDEEERDQIINPGKVSSYFLRDKECFDSSEFHIMFLDADTVTNVTTLNRVSSRRVLLYMGNMDGIISYGKGYGNDYADAYECAVENCKRNLIAIPLDQHYTNPTFLTGSYNNCKVEIFPARSCDYWGYPLWHDLLVLAGLSHFRFRVVTKNKNIYPIVYSFFNALTKNKTPKMVAEATGKKIYEISYGIPLKRTKPTVF